MSVLPNYVPRAYNTITINLIVPDADKAIKFYNSAFDAELLLKLEDPDGRVSGNARAPLHPRDSEGDADGERQRDPQIVLRADADQQSECDAAERRVREAVAHEAEAALHDEHAVVSRQQRNKHARGERTLHEGHGKQFGHWLAPFRRFS